MMCNGECDPMPRPTFDLDDVYLPEETSLEAAPPAETTTIRSPSPELVSGHVPGFFVTNVGQPMPMFVPKIRFTTPSFAAVTAYGSSAPKVTWHPTVTLPPQFPQLLASGVLCHWCTACMNIVIREDGFVERLICEHCRVRLIYLQENRCSGGAPGCKSYRFVDYLGNVAPLCKVCHKAGVPRARTARATQIVHTF